MAGRSVAGGGIFPPLGETTIGSSRPGARARKQRALKPSLSTLELEARQAALRARIEASAAPAAKKARMVAPEDEVGDCATMLAALQDATEAVLDVLDAEGAKHAAALKAARAERQARRGEALKMAEENAALKEENAALKAAIAERLAGHGPPGAAPPSETKERGGKKLRRLSACLSFRDRKFDANEKAQMFFERILDFVAAKNKLDETARRVLPQNFMNAFASFKREDLAVQMPLTPPIGVSNAASMSLDEVYLAAERARPEFAKLMNAIVVNAGVEPDAPVIVDGRPLGYKQLESAPLKGRARAREKIEDDYRGQARRLCDCVRCSVIVNSEAQLIAVAQALEDSAAAPDGVEFKVVKLKNRFKEPLYNGYRDALYSIRVRVPGTDAWHVCEMQLHLAEIIAHKSATHVLYEFFRSYFAGNMEAVDERMQVLIALGGCVGASASLGDFVQEVAKGDDEQHMQQLEFMLCSMLGEHALALKVREGRIRLVKARQKSGGGRRDRTLRFALLEHYTQYANLCRTAGLFNEAESTYESTYQSLFDEFGDEHPLTLECASGLARLLRETQRFAQAQPWYLYLFHTKQRLLGPDDPSTLYSGQGLANLLRETGKFAEAESLYRDVLARQTRVIESRPSHHGTASFRSSPAIPARELPGDNGANLAEMVIEEIQRVAQRSGRRPDLLRAFEELDSNGSGRISEREFTDELRRLGFDIRSDDLRKLIARFDVDGDGKVDYPEFCNAACSERGRGTLRGELGLTRADVDHSRVWLAQALIGQTRGYDADGADGADAMTAKLAEAEQLLQAANESHKSNLGAEHPDTLCSQRELAFLQMRKGHFARAEAEFAVVHDALTIRLGENHPNTRIAAMGRALAMLRLRRFDEAKPIIVRVSELNRAHLVRQYPDLALPTGDDLGAWEECCDEFQLTYGVGHLASQWTRNRFAILLLDAGRHEEAIEHLTTTHTQRRQRRCA